MSISGCRYRFLVAAILAAAALLIFAHGPLAVHANGGTRPVVKNERVGPYELEVGILPGSPRVGNLHLSPNPPKDTDGRREDSGRGWVRELQGRWPEVLG